MKISSRGQYAIKAMLQLAINDHTGPVSLADIARVNKISISYLEQIFSKLRGDHLIESVRGPGGGYRLGKPLSSISIAQILDSIDGKPMHDEDEENGKPSIMLWGHISEMVHDYLDEITLIRLLDHPDIPKEAIVSDRTSHYIASMFKPTLATNSFQYS